MHYEILGQPLATAGGVFKFKKLIASVIGTKCLLFAGHDGQHRENIFLEFMISNYQVMKVSGINYRC
jgi:hypothetical protein